MEHEVHEGGHDLPVHPAEARNGGHPVEPLAPAYPLFLQHERHQLLGEDVERLALKVVARATIGVISAIGILAELPSAQTSQAFEVASVKPNNSGALQTGSKPEGDRFTASNIALRQLILMAYNIGTDRLIGGPSWVNSDRFDVVAKAEAPFSPPNQWQFMLRALLADRFKLVVHTETRDAPTYALLMARRDGQLGPKLRVATTDCATLRATAPPGDNDPCGSRTASGALATGRMTVRGTDIGLLVGILARDAGRPIVNNTGLSGNFDWDLTWTPQVFLQRSFDRERFPSIDADGPSIFTAVQEQLGLKFDSQKGSIDVIVIDRAERPAPD